MFDVRVQLGAVLRIAADDRFRPADGPVTVWVTGVRLVSNRPECDEWVWVEGFKLDATGRRGPQTQILVRAALLPARVADR
ncbi:hypothetical protein [Micromonospora yangpuensis]|uniref:Uncharacterized protein n=1 Tax=Micromonospora yangpuensis TaxID=683228 RepID=A0A1C6U2Q8_9ACTN|nr:hypothetical protein [Micromonospora yangpuensis]GGM10294.1 hypothetical protein GCM10012279_30400 [Micromonospora yangpuensis]SCL48191.1 hypothetical protein GA0070617_0803 [Micromonospora yangpuensis]